MLARESKSGQKQLAAYLIPNQRPAPAIKELRDFLRPRLPDYMVPSAFVFLDAWPLTPNGKVDRDALPAPDRAGLKPGEKFAAPRNPMEETVAKIWSEMLGRARLGIHDNFFERGGHSLLAAQAVSRLKESFNIHLSIRSLFEKPTVAEFAKEIERRTARPAQQRAPGLTRVSRDKYRIIPLSANAGAEMAKHT